MTADVRIGDPFLGDAKLRALCRALDWSATPMGPVESWPAALKTTIRTCLESPYPTSLWCGPEMTFIYNDAYRNSLIAKHPWALGRSGSEVWAEAFDRIGPLLEEVRAGGSPHFAEDVEFDLERGEGEDRSAWFTFSYSAVRDENGEVVAVMNIVWETTGRVLDAWELQAAKAAAQKSENRVREVFAHAPSFLAVLRGPDLAFEYVNEAYYQLVGHRKLVGIPVFEALPEVRGQGFEEILMNVVETGETFVGREIPIMVSRAPGGEPEQRFLDFVYYPVVEEDGTRSGVVAHGSDVTDHVLARQEAQRARTEAEDANRAKSQFLANMSHEIRTPINAIMGYTELMEMGIPGPVTAEQRSQLERVKMSSRHLLMLIDDILDLAKVEAGRMKMEAEQIRTADSVAAAIALLAPQAEAAGITLVDDCTADTQVFYLGDSARVRQILVNLLSNAVKFTPADGEIRVTCGTEDAPGKDIEFGGGGPLTYIRVADTGIGIAPEELRSIFKPFSQVERGHTRTRGGTGLGLTISRQLARLMGGDLTVQSEPGEGSAFTLWLPMEAQAPPLEETLLDETPETRPHNLAAVGHALQAQIPDLLNAFRARLQEDPLIPMAMALPDVDLEDHISTFLTDIAQSLIVLETSETAPERMLMDGSEIQRVVSVLHGRQRAELGWTAEALTREWEILREEIHATIRRSMRRKRVSGALDLLERFIDRAQKVSRRSLRQALGTSGE